MTIWQAMNMFETLTENESQSLVIDRRIQDYVYKVIRLKRNKKYESDRYAASRRLTK